MSKKLLMTATELNALQFWMPHVENYVNNGYDVTFAASTVSNRFDELREELNKHGCKKLYSLSLKRSPFTFNTIKGLNELIEIMKSDNFDCVITNEPVMGLTTRIACRFAKNKKTIKVVYLAHGFHFYKGGSKLKNLFYKTLEMSMAKITDSLITSNYEDYEEAKKFKYRNNGKAYHIDGMGINLNRFIPMTNDNLRKEKRRELGISPDEKAIIFIGELNTNKNQKVLIDGIKVLKDKGKKVKLILCGKGDNRTNLEKQCEELGLSRDVIFLGYRKDVNKIIPLCDIGTSSSIREGFGINLAEDMASGLPIVASNNRAHRDIVESGKSGYIFDCNNPEEFAGYIERIIDNDNLAESMRKYNIEKSKNYDVNKIKNDILEIVEETIHRY